MSATYPMPNELRIRRAGEDWIAIPLQSPLTVQQVTSFPPKVTIGEANKGSHPMLSTWGFDGLPGGHGIAKHDGTTSHRYRSGIVDTSSANFIASPSKVQSISGAAAAFMPHNDLVVSGTRRFYGTFGTSLRLFDESTDTFGSSAGTLSAVAVNPGVAFKGTSTLRLFIPCGATGYATWDGTTLTNVAASGTKPAAKDFARLGTLLICLDVSSQLWYSTDGSTWTSYGGSGALEAGIVGNRLAIYKNGYGDKTVHVATNMGLFAFDPAGPVLYDTDLALPPHPYQGASIHRWRDQLYLSSGLNVFSWNGSAVNAMGLDRNDGLPEEFIGTTGRITDLAADINNLYAIIGAGNMGVFSVHAWTGEGWRCLWAGTSDLLSSTGKLVVSSAQDGYRLWWGYGNNAMTVANSVSFANAERVLELGGGTFERSWFLETGMNAFEMDGFTKIISTAEWDEYTASDSAVSFGYRTDPEDPLAAYTNLESYSFPTGTSSTGAWVHRTYQFGYDSTNERYYGLPCDQIEFRFTGPGNSNWTGPDIVKNFVLSFQKVVEGYRAWSTPINLQRYYDQGQGDIADLINDLVLSNAYCDFQYRTEIIRVKFSSWSGVDETGQAHHGGMRRVSILEIPSGP